MTEVSIQTTCRAVRCQERIQCRVTVRYRSHGEQHTMVQGYCGDHGVQRIGRLHGAGIDEVILTAADHVTPMYLIDGRSI